MYNKAIILRSMESLTIVNTLLETPTQPMASPASPPLLEVKNLTKTFPVKQGLLGMNKGTVQAVSDVSFSIPTGRTLGLVGESGCGKTTLSRCLLRLIEPTTGEIWLDGQPFHALKGDALRQARRNMQMVFQNPYASLNPKLTIRETLAEPFEIFNLAKGQALEAELFTLLDLVGLPKEALGRMPHEFSGGQRQRIGIARALALKPKLLIADEPVSALDVSVQAQILNLLQSLKQELGLTLLFISHNLSVVEHLCDDVMVMYLGRIVENAPKEALFTNPQHPYTQSLLRAVPIADPVVAKANKLLYKPLVGDLPNPANPPSGCAFHTRCPVAVERCSAERPVLAPCGEGLVACWEAGK